MSYLRILIILIWFEISTAVEIPLTLVFPGQSKVTSKISVKPGTSKSLSRKTRFRAEELCQVRGQIMTEIEFRHAFCRSELGDRLRDNVISDMKKWRGYHGYLGRFNCEQHVNFEQPGGKYFNLQYCPGKNVGMKLSDYHSQNEYCALFAQSRSRKTSFLRGGPDGDYFNPGLRCDHLRDPAAQYSPSNYNYYFQCCRQHIEDGDHRPICREAISPKRHLRVRVKIGRYHSIDTEVHMHDCLADFN